MATKATQKNRDFAIKTALGEDDLLLRRATISERLGRPFQIVVELLSEEPDINFDDIVGQKAGIRVSRGGEDIRYFHGYVSQFQQLEQEHDFARYSLTLVPWLWFLTCSSDCRIFQGKTAVEIIEQIFKDHGFNDFKNSLVGSFPTREYCVQYRETAFNFVSRLMEEEGIYYFFEHQKDKHTLVLANEKSAHTPFGEYKDVECRPGSEALGDRECITDWVMERSVQPGVFAHSDYNFETPKTRLLANANIARKHAEAEHEIYDYPGEYVDNSSGERTAKIRIEELQTPYEVFQGCATARGMCAGSLFNLKAHSREDQNREYLITGTEMQLDAGAYEAGQEGDTKSFLSCNLTAIDSARPYRSQRSTPKPLVQGPQTAVVTGKSGEEIWPDKYGRVKVQFHWDREGEFDENSSCWIRVAQVWAGKQWGVMHIPRIGQEVIVEFLEGDPDRPIITGRVYNADQTVPYDLPANKTQSGIKSRSSKDGTGENFNEIRFEDKKGEEELYIHAEKDQVIEVENDKTESVGHDETITIENDRQESVGGNETLSVSKDRTRSVDGEETISIAKNRTKSVDKDEQTTIGGNRTETVDKDETISIGQNRNETVEKSETVQIGKSRDVQVTDNDNHQVGKKLTIDVGDQISLLTGNASLTMKKDGTIIIKGKDITINASGKINIKASSDVAIKGSKVLTN